MVPPLTVRWGSSIALIFIAMIVAVGVYGDFPKVVRIDGQLLPEGRLCRRCDIDVRKYRGCAGGGRRRGSDRAEDCEADRWI